MISRSKLYKILIFFCSAFCVAHALEWEFVKSSPHAINLVVAPMDATAGRESKAISQDLKKTGVFRLFPSTILMGESKPTAQHWSNWRQNGAQYLVTLQSIESQGSKSLALNLYRCCDTPEKQDVTPLATTHVLDNGHLSATVANWIHQAATGIPGLLGTHLAYIRVLPAEDKCPIRYQLVTSEWQTSKEKVVLEQYEPLMSPAWSPDGRQLAFVSFQKFRSAICVLDLKTLAVRVVSCAPGINSSPRWSPDGRFLAVVLSKESVPNLYLLDVQTLHCEQATAGFAVDTEPVWWPDGESLVFSSNRGGSAQIYRLFLKEKEVKIVPLDGEENTSPRLTQDAGKIVFLQKDGMNYHIVWQDLKRGTLHRLPSQSHLNDSLTLSPNGQWVVYGCLDKGTRKLAMTHLDGQTAAFSVNTIGEVQDPAWSPFISDLLEGEL